MQHSWCSCSAIAVARAAVVLLWSEPVMPLVHLAAIWPPAEKHDRRALAAAEQQAGSSNVLQWTRSSSRQRQHVPGHHTSLQPLIPVTPPPPSVLEAARCSGHPSWGTARFPVRPTLFEDLCYRLGGQLSALSSGNLMPGVRNLTGHAGAESRGGEEGGAHQLCGRAVISFSAWDRTRSTCTVTNCPCHWSVKPEACSGEKLYHH